MENLLNKKKTGWKIVLFVALVSSPSVFSYPRRPNNKRLSRSKKSMKPSPVRTASSVMETSSHDTNFEDDSRIRSMMAWNAWTVTQIKPPCRTGAGKDSRSDTKAAGMS